MSEPNLEEIKARWKRPNPIGWRLEEYEVDWLIALAEKVPILDTEAAQMGDHVGFLQSLLAASQKKVAELEAERDHWEVQAAQAVEFGRLADRLGAENSTLRSQLVEAMAAIKRLDAEVARLREALGKIVYAGFTPDEMRQSLGWSTGSMEPSA